LLRKYQEGYAAGIYLFIYLGKVKFKNLHTCVIPVVKHKTRRPKSRWQDHTSNYELRICLLAASSSEGWTVNWLYIFPFHDKWALSWQHVASSPCGWRGLSDMEDRYKYSE